MRHNKWPFMYNDKCIIIVDADRLFRECPIINGLSPLRSRGRGADRSNFDLSNLSFQILYLIYTIFSLSSQHLIWTKCQRILSYCIYYRNWISVQHYMHLFVRFTIHLLIYIAYNISLMISACFSCVLLWLVTWIIHKKYRKMFYNHVV